MPSPQASCSSSKLHAPDNYIVGGGIFSHSSNVPLSIAWDAFGEKNGVPTLDEMRTRIAYYRRTNMDTDSRLDPSIGCRILTQPFFWPRELWIDAPPSWSPNIVSGKAFDTSEPDGRQLWEIVTARLAVHSAATPSTPTPTARYGPPQLITPRLGQGAFRLTVTDNYERRCAVTGERTLPILDAAHIRSYAAGGEHVPSNGLLLRTDIHRLFDLGYVTVDPERRFAVSMRLKADIENGRHYYDLHGTVIYTPRAESGCPSHTALEWHRENRFLG